MNTKLAKDLADSLKSYSVDMSVWEPGIGDTFIAFGNREFLRRHGSALTRGQRDSLQKADAQVLKLAAADYGDEANDDDVRTLLMIVNIINGQPLSKAAA